jgi:hypothetical protein
MYGTHCIALALIGPSDRKLHLSVIFHFSTKSKRSKASNTSYWGVLMEREAGIGLAFFVVVHSFGRKKQASFHSHLQSEYRINEMD